MNVEKIYLQGTHFGLYGSGEIIFARRNAEPGVEKGKFYTIKKVVEGNVGVCAKNLAIVLKEVEGQYNKNNFKVTEECLKRMQVHS